MTILIAAVSGRALCAAAQRAGQEVIVGDFFGDMDTRRMAPWVPLPGDLERGVDPRGLRRMVAEWDQPIEGVVYGAGFEADPFLLNELAQLAPLRGNAPEVVARIKDPHAFAALLRSLGLPHPRISSRLPETGSRWLRKKRGGAGGCHVHDASASDEPASYYQEFAAGRAISALFVANGQASRVLGFSEQWTAPSRTAPFRYGGCAGPLPVAVEFARRVDEACNAITATAGLVGLNSLDMLVEDDFTILEVNPRPGATVEIFDAPERGMSLWRLHLDGIAGVLPGKGAPPSHQVRAAAILYANRTFDVPGVVHWPTWVADIPAPRSTIAADAPICTIIAEAGDLATAREEVGRRAEMIRRELELRAESQSFTLQVPHE